MTFSQYAGTAIIPTLARIVLAVAFVSAGWNKVFKKADLTTEQAARLKTELGVEPEPAPTRTASLLQPAGLNHQFILASFRQDPAEPAGVSEPPPPEVAAPPAAAPTTPSTTASGKLQARQVYLLALTLHENKFPKPLWMAWLAAFTELFGGAMLLIGLFSRIWGLGLSIAMGVAFYLVTMKQNGIFTMDPRTFAENQLAFNTAFCQAGLFLLAFGIFLTGAGPLSLDRILFGGSDDEEAGEVKID
jgi:uncharacterized membrane protein YphA (DoxX/SURF4 family)